VRKVMTGRHLLAAVLGPVSLILASCAEEQPTGGGGSEVSITVESPTDGEQVASPVELQLSVNGVEIGPPDTGLMHFHVYVGDSADYQVLPSLSGEVPAPRGQQTLRIVLAEPNHTETNVITTVSVEVTSGQAGAGGGGYDYGGGSGSKGYGSDDEGS
jgi:hypothetical protein